MPSVASNELVSKHIRTIMYNHSLQGWNALRGNAKGKMVAMALASALLMILMSQAVSRWSCILIAERTRP